MEKIKKPSTSELQRIQEDVKKWTIESDDQIKATELKRQKKFGQKKDKFYKIKFNDRRKLRVDPESSFLVRMLFANGTTKIFVVNSKQNTFKFRKKTYYLYYEEAWYDLSMNQYLFIFHENFAVPINREIEQIGKEAYFNVRPDNLEKLIKFEYVKVLAGALNLDKMLKMIVVICFIILAVVVILALLQSGIIKAQ